MKNTLLILSFATLAATGCSKHNDTRATPPPAPKPAAAAQPTAAVAETPATPPPVTSVKPEEVAPELAPVQSGIEQFKSQNGRVPFDVQELLASKTIASLPPLPPGKIYVIEKPSGIIRVMTGP